MRDIYLRLTAATMKQLIKPIFTFTGKHASWYGGKGGVVGIGGREGGEHLISAGVTW